MKHFKKYKKCIEFTKILILNKMDCAGRNSAGIFFAKFFLPPKFKHIKNRAKEILKKGAPANGRYERYGRFGKTKRKRVR